MTFELQSSLLESILKSGQVKAKVGSLPKFCETSEQKGGSVVLIIFVEKSDSEIESMGETNSVEEFDARKSVVLDELEELFEMDEVVDLLFRMWEFSTRGLW